MGSRLFTPIMQWLLPPARFPRSDDVAFAQAAMVMLWACSASAITILGAISEFVFGGAAGTLLLAAASLVVILALVFRRRGRTETMAQLIVATQMLSIAAMLAVSGGRLVGLVLILPMFVFLAVVLLPRRAAIAWSVFAVLCIIGSRWLALHWTSPWIVPPADWVANAPYRVPLISTLLAAVAGLAFVAIYRALVQRVAEGRERERRLAAQSLGQERRLRAITENLPALISWFDAEERCRFTNGPRAWPGQVFPGDPHDRTLAELIGADAYAAMHSHVRTALAGGHASFDVNAGDAGRVLCYRAHFVPDDDPDGGPRGFYAMAFDVTEQKTSELRASASERRMRLIADNVPVAISYIDSSERYRFNNLMYERWFRRPTAAITGRALREILGDDNYARIQPWLHRALGGETVEFDVDLQRDRELRRQRGRYTPDIDASGRVVGVIGMVQDVTELVRLQDDLTRQAHYDSLTGLANRYRLYELLNQALRRYARTARGLAVLYLDLDRFKAINDTWGHAAGDAVLTEFACRLNAGKRHGDAAARLAGDEFVLLLEDCDDFADARAVAERIEDVMQATFPIQDHELHVGVSIGIAMVQPGDSAEDLLKRADRALYADKARRRGLSLAAAGGNLRSTP